MYERNLTSNQYYTGSSTVKMEVVTDEKCTCPCPTKHNTSKSWRQRIKERFIKPSRIIRSSPDLERQESGEEDGESSSSRSSSGIGTLSTRSKPQHEEVEVESYPPPVDVVTESQSATVVQSGSKTNIWISKTNLGVFSKLKRSTADIYDKISLAENDDRDFEVFSNNDDIEEEEVMKVKDWHINLKKNEEEEGKKQERVQVSRQV